MNVTAFGGEGISISAVGNVSGTAISPVVNVSGESITASLVGNSVSATGDTSGAAMGVPQSNVAKEDTKVADDASTTVSKSDDQEDETKKKQNGTIALAQKTSRVTVLLPQRN